MIFVNIKIRKSDQTKHLALAARSEGKRGKAKVENESEHAKGKESKNCQARGQNDKGINRSENAFSF